MNAVEMQHSFQSKLKAFGLDPTNFDSYTIEKLFNEAQDVFVDIYAPTVDTVEISRKKLSPLIKTESIVPTATGADNLSTAAMFVTLPTDIRITLLEYIKDSGEAIKVKPIKYDQYLIDIDNPHKKPYSELVWRLDIGEGGLKHEIITDGTVTADTYHIRYIAQPTAISIGSVTTPDLNANDHEEIVNIALNLLLGQVKKQIEERNRKA